MDFFSDDDNSNGVHELDLIPMIAIFSMLILFLVSGMVLTEAKVSVPTHLKLAKGANKEQVSASPIITIDKGKVIFSPSNKRYSLSVFNEIYRSHAQRRKLRQDIKKYKSSKKSAKKIIPFQLVADKSISYRVIYNVVNELRNDGVESFLFVSEVGYEL